MSQNLFGFASAEGQIAFAILVIIFWGSESVIASRRRAREGDRTEDRGSLRVRSIVFPLAWWAGIAMIRVPHVSFGTAHVFDVGLILMAAGQLLRWWSSATPADAAILLVHLGAGLCFGNALTLVILVLPIVAALLYRNRLRVDG